MRLPRDILEASKKLLLNEEKLTSSSVCDMAVFWGISLMWHEREKLRRQQTIFLSQDTVRTVPFSAYTSHFRAHMWNSLVSPRPRLLRIFQACYQSLNRRNKLLGFSYFHPPHRKGSLLWWSNFLRFRFSFRSSLIFFLLFFFLLYFLYIHEITL